MTIPSPGRDFVSLRDAACARADAREESQCVAELEFKQQQVQSSAPVSSSLSLILCIAHGDSGARIYERKKLEPAPIICFRVGGSFSQNPETKFLSGPGGMHVEHHAASAPRCRGAGDQRCVELIT